MTDQQTTKIPRGKDKAAVPLEQATDAELRRFVNWYDGDPTGAVQKAHGATAQAAREELERRLQARVKKESAEAQAAAQAVNEREPGDDAEPEPEPKREPAPRARRQQAEPRQQAAPVTQAKRQGPKPAEPEPAQTTALATTQWEGGSSLALAATRDVQLINAKLYELGQQFHLVSPAPSVDVIPEGFGVQVAIVHVNRDTSKSDDTYKVGEGERVRHGLSAPVLKGIWKNAKGDWDPQWTDRLDNMREPYWCRFRAVGWVPNFDGTLRRVIGFITLDLREGGADEQEIRRKAAKKYEWDLKAYRNKELRWEPRKDDPKYTGEAQLLEYRKFIERHAETKAKLRAISDLIKRSYRPEELDKPFAVATLMFTGQTDDPVLRQQFAIMRAQAALQGTRALYGGGSAPQLPAAPAMPGMIDDPELQGGMQAPPPVAAGTLPDDDDVDYDFDLGPAL